MENNERTPSWSTSVEEIEYLDYHKYVKIIVEQTGWGETGLLLFIHKDYPIDNQIGDV